MHAASFGGANNSFVCLYVCLLGAWQKLGLALLDLLCSLWELAGFGGLESTLIFWCPMLGWYLGCHRTPWSQNVQRLPEQLCFGKGAPWVALCLGSRYTFPNSSQATSPWRPDPRDPWSVRVSWGCRRTWDEIERINLHGGTFKAEELIFILDSKSEARLLLPPIVYFSLSLYNPLEINTQKFYQEVAQLLSEVSSE